MVVITQELHDMARAAGACRRGMRACRVGTPITHVHRDYLAWYEARFPDRAGQIAQQLLAGTQVRLRGRVFLAFSGYGDGDSSGYGDGDSSGYGYGDSSGYGYGYGDSYGFGFGDGDGFGYGDGYGYGGRR